jgi:hypothetical protein
MRFQEFGKGVYELSKLKPLEGSNISKTANAIKKYQKKHHLEPGSEDWIKLWFARPYLTGENPYSK